MKAGNLLRKRSATKHTLVDSQKNNSKICGTKIGEVLRKLGEGSMRPVVPPLLLASEPNSASYVFGSKLVTASFPLHFIAALS